MNESPDIRHQPRRLVAVRQMAALGPFKQFSLRRTPGLDAKLRQRAVFTVHALHCQPLLYKRVRLCSRHGLT
ncbi:hypothetical protein [Polaromonas sp. DSP2-3-2b2]|uniref:hypothetical protein n=1 Tax=Polaromonas sp. DSP2-3-2b2 TaxID=2804662 RepID=UPI003CEB9004